MTGAEVVQTRRSVFGEMTSALKYIAGHWDDSASYGDLAQAAAVIERDAKNLPKLFPAGTSESDGLRTAASDAIWTGSGGLRPAGRASSPPRRQSSPGRRPPATAPRSRARSGWWSPPANPAIATTAAIERHSAISGSTPAVGRGSDEGLGPAAAAFSLEPAAPIRHRLRHRQSRAVLRPAQGGRLRPLRPADLPPDLGFCRQPGSALLELHPGTEGGTRACPRASSRPGPSRARTQCPGRLGGRRHAHPAAGRSGLGSRSAAPSTTKARWHRWCRMPGPTGWRPSIPSTWICCSP